MSEPRSAAARALRLEWRVESGDVATPSVGLSATVRDAVEALRLVNGLASGSRCGEYRISDGAAAPVYTNAACIADWCATGRVMPRPAELSVWRREVEQQAQMLDFLVALRSLLTTAAFRGLITREAGNEAFETLNGWTGFAGSRRLSPPAC